MKKDIVNLLEFLRRYPNRWHGFHDDARTNKAVLEVFHKNYGLMINWNTRQMFYNGGNANERNLQTK